MTNRQKTGNKKYRKFFTLCAIKSEISGNGGSTAVTRKSCGLISTKDFFMKIAKDDLCSSCRAIRPRFRECSLRNIVLKWDSSIHSNFEGLCKE